MEVRHSSLRKKPHLNAVGFPWPAAKIKVTVTHTVKQVTECGVDIVQDALDSVHKHS